MSEETSNLTYTYTPMKITDTRPIALRWYQSSVNQSPVLQYAYTEYESGKGNQIVWADVKYEYGPDYVDAG